MEPSLGGCIYSTAPTDGGVGKSQRVRKFATIVCHLGISEATLMEVSPVWLPKQDMNKDVCNRHTNMIKESLLGLSPPQRATSSWGMQRMGEISLPQGRQHPYQSWKHIHPSYIMDYAGDVCV